MGTPPLNVRHLAIAVLVTVGAFLVWPQPDDGDLKRAEENGYRAARKAQRHRTLAAVALARRDSAIRSTDAAFRDARARLRTFQDFRIVAIDSFPARLDSTPRAVVGHLVAGDTLIPIRLARFKVLEVVAAADSAIGTLQAIVMLERGRSSLAIQHLQATITAQDSLVAALRVQVKAKTRPWYRRALGGVEHAATGALCGGAGWLLGGPLPALGAGAVCAAVSGARR